MSQSSGPWEDSFSVRSGQPRPGWIPSLAATSDVEGSAGADLTLNTTNSFEVVPPGQEARQNTQPMQALAMGVGLPPGLSAEETRSQRSNFVHNVQILKGHRSDRFHRWQCQKAKLLAR